MGTNTAPRLPLFALPVFAGALVLFTMHLSYLIAATQGHVPWCFPWIDSCTSISATGRQWPERGVFKPLMTIAALCVAASFWLSARWLAALGDVPSRTQRLLPHIAWLMALCIVAYVAALGEAGQAARLLRKTGVTLGFGLTFLAEILLLARMAALQRVRDVPWPRSRFRLLFALIALTLVLGVTSVLLSAFHAGYARMDDAFEWVFALLLNGWLLVLGLAWRDSGFALVAQVNSQANLAANDKPLA
jgi:hypothetical protein